MGMDRGGGSLSLGGATGTFNLAVHRGGSQSCNSGFQRGRRPEAGQNFNFLLSTVLGPGGPRGDGDDRGFLHWNVQHGLIEQGSLGAYPKMPGHGAGGGLPADFPI